MIQQRFAVALATALAICLPRLSHGQDRPRGTYVVVPPAPSLRFGPGPRHRVLYVNRLGGTFTPGWDDSSRNVSSVPTAIANVAAWSYGDTAWARLLGCVRAMYARFDLEVTDVDPGDVPHIEAVVGGRPSQVGQPSYVGGVAPVAGDCSVVEQAVVYVFAGIFDGDVQSICETVAQESAHALGLDHEYLCEDPMTYLVGCGPKQFQDIDASCGEDGPRTCMCGDATQNSVQVLYSLLGPARADVAAPTVRITSPAEGASVPAGFTVTVDAQDNVGVTRVELLLDGRSMATDTASPWALATPPALAPGAHDVEVRVQDAAGNSAADTVRVSISGSPAAGTCASDGDCPSGETCMNGACAPAAAPGEVGAACSAGADCNSGMCGSDGARRLCTESCASDASCPDGFACRGSSEGSGVCWPTGRAPSALEDSAGSGGCAAAGGRGGTALGAAAAILLAILAARRRR